jgi:flagellin
MAMSIRTNVSSLDARRNLYQSQMQLDSSLSRLGSGYRITKAGDDAAGLGISVNLQAQIRSYAQAARNAQDGISLVQTAEGSMNEITNVLIRLRELAMESSSAGVNDDQRGYIQTEVDELVKEIDRIAHAAEYNGKQLLAPEGTSVELLEFQVGIRTAGDGTPGSDTTNTITLSTADLTAETLGLKTGFDFSSADGARSALGKIDTALDLVSETRARFGAAGNRLDNAISNIQSTAQNLAAAHSRIRDVDIAEETSAMTRAQILLQAGVSVLAQANQIPQSALKLLGN